MTVVCDSGVIYAALDRSDSSHARCAAFLSELDEGLLVPPTVIAEVDWLARSWGVPAATDALLAAVEEGSVAVTELRLDEYARVRELLSRYASLGLSFVDASVIAIAERLRETRIATLDHRHFSVVRPRHVRAFTLLPH